MKNTRRTIYLIFSICLLSGILLFAYYFYSSSAIPSVFLGNWEADYVKTVAFNKNMPTWKAEYEKSLLESKRKLGYLITDKTITLVINGESTIPVAYKIKSISPEEVVLTVYDKTFNKAMSVNLEQAGSDCIRIKFELNQFYMIYSRRNN
ncbi:MAG: hypothetical protein ACYC2P_13425 [Paludibacteraceae bacterium]